MPKHRSGSPPKGTSSKLPMSWPKTNNIEYLTKPVYSKALSFQGIELLQSSTTSVRTVPLSFGPCSRVRITPITSSSHPANGQYGLFASQNLQAGSFILFYLGYVHSDKDSEPGSNYDLSLDRELGVGVDATIMGNESRFINDYRGISSSGPNVEFVETWVDIGKGLAEKRMAVYVLPAGKSGKKAKGIAKGEEILVSYGRGFWKQRLLDAENEIDRQPAELVAPGI